MTAHQTLNELELDLGEKLKRLRLNKNWDQKTIAARAGVSVRALRNIEAGHGSTVKTLLSVVRALGRESWLQTIAPVATINPLTLTSRASERVRATSPMARVKAAERRLAATEPADAGLANAGLTAREGPPASGLRITADAARHRLETANPATEPQPESAQQG